MKLVLENDLAATLSYAFPCQLWGLPVASRVSLRQILSVLKLQSNATGS